MTKNDAPPTKTPTKDDGKKTTPPLRTRQDRAYRAWQLHLTGTPAHIITQNLKTLGFKCSQRTIERDLSDMRAKRQIDQATKPDLYKRDLAQSVDEKKGLFKKLQEIVEKPARFDEKGNEEDRSFVQVHAIRAATVLSRDLDRLYGLDLSAVRMKLDEHEAAIASLQQALAARKGPAANQGADSAKPSSGSPAPGPS